MIGYVRLWLVHAINPVSCVCVRLRISLNEQYHDVNGKLSKQLAHLDIFLDTTLLHQNDALNGMKTWSVGAFSE